MEQITIKGKIEFLEEVFQKYNREFTAILQESAAFAYGNQTAVFICWGAMQDGKTPTPVWLDTRYDKTIKRNEADFKEWVRNYFVLNYSDHILTIY